GGRVRATREGGTWRSPALPEGGTPPATWGRVTVGGLSGAAGDVTVSVLDAEDDAPIDGFAGLVPDGAGAVDLSALDPAEHPAIRVEVTLRGEAELVPNDSGATHLLASPVLGAPEGGLREFPYFMSPRGEIAVDVYDPDAGTDSFAFLVPDGAGGYDRARIPAVDALGANTYPVHFDDELLALYSWDTGTYTLLGRDDPASPWVVRAAGETGGGTNYNDPTGYRLDDGRFILALGYYDEVEDTTRVDVVVQDFIDPTVFRTTSFLLPSADTYLVGVHPSGDLFIGENDGAVFVAHHDGDFAGYELEAVPTDDEDALFEGTMTDAQTTTRALCFANAADVDATSVLEERDGAWVVSRLPAPEGANNAYCRDILGDGDGVPVGHFNLDGVNQAVAWLRDDAGDYVPTPLSTGDDGVVYDFGGVTADRGALIAYSVAGGPAVGVFRLADGAVTGWALPISLAEGWRFETQVDYYQRQDGFIGYAYLRSSNQTFAGVPDLAEPSGYRLVELATPAGWDQSSAQVVGGPGGAVVGSSYRYRDGLNEYVTTVWPVSPGATTASGLALAAVEGPPIATILGTGGVFAVGYADNPLDDVAAGPPSDQDQPLPQAAVIPGGVEGNDTAADFSQTDLDGDALVWFPEWGSAPDDYAYRLLPRPYRTRDNHAAFVTEDGAIAGWGIDVDAHNVAIAWLPEGDGGAYVAKPLLFDRASRFSLDEEDLVHVSARNGNYAGKYAFGYGFDAAGDWRQVAVMRAEHVASGFAVLPAFWDFNVTDMAIDTRAGMMGFRGPDGLPRVWTADENGDVVYETLPSGDLEGEVVDIFNGRVLGALYADDGDHVVVWERDGGGGWLMADYGVDDEPIGLGPEGQVLVDGYPFPHFLVPDGDGGASVVLLDEAGLTPNSHAYDLRNPHHLAGLRDGFLMVSFWEPGDITNQQVAVAPLPTVAEPTFCFTIAKSTNGAAAYYHRAGSFVLDAFGGYRPSVTYYTWRPDGRFGETEAWITYELREKEYLAFSDVIGLASANGNLAAPIIGQATPRGPAAWWPWDAPDRYVGIETRRDDGGLADVLTRVGSDVFNFSNPEQLELWGSDLATTAGFTGITVEYAPGAATLRYQLVVTDVCAPLENVVWASARVGEANEANNEARAVLPVAGAALTAVVTPSAATVAPGGSLAFTVVVTNVGDAPVIGASYVFELPPELDLDPLDGELVAEGGALGAGQSATLGP
ncbi:MAG: hypothetical protein KC635_19995, partial [Myxococcales bacterium]|nr:hypothetical protein [Myxococcales bacterium]